MFTPKKATPHNSVLGPVKFIDDHAYITKSRELVLHLETAGVHFECLTDANLDEIHLKLTQAVKALPESIRVYTYLVKTEGADLESQLLNIEDPAALEAVRYRKEFLSGKHGGSPLFTIQLHTVFVLEPGGFLQISSPYTLRISKKKLAKMTSELYTAVNAFSQQTRELIDARVQTKDQVFLFLRFLTSFDREIAGSEKLIYDDNLDYWMTSQHIRPTLKGLVMDRMKVEVLTFKKLPTTTTSNVFAEMLKIPGNFVICSQFKPRPVQDTTAKINAAQKHFHWSQWIKDPQTMLQMAFNKGDRSDIVKDESAREAVRDLALTSKRINRGDVIGDFHLALIFFDPKNQDRLDIAVNRAIKIVGERMGSLQRETYYAFGSYLAIVPGAASPVWKKRIRVREVGLPVSQFVDMAQWYNYSQGSLVNPLTSRPARTVLVSDAGTPIFFNLVMPNSDRSGTVIIGESGSGKSTFANFQINEHQKDNPYTLILDGLGGSFRFLTQIHGGAYYELRSDDRWPFTLNPCATENSMVTRKYLSTLARLCMSVGGFQHNAESNQIVYEEISRVMELPFEQRRFGKLKFPKKMAPYIAAWQGKGEHGFLFDNEYDTFQLNRFQTIDFSLLRKFPELLSPLLLHLFHLWDEVMYSPELLTTPKEMWVDEGWDVLGMKAASNYIVEAGRTWRKRLGGLVLMTQSLDELKGAGIMNLMRELCPLTILLKNVNADFAKYGSDLCLNEKVVERFSGLNMPGDGLMISAQHTQVFHARLSKREIFLFGNDPFLTEKREKALAKHGSIEQALAMGAYA